MFNSCNGLLLCFLQMAEEDKKRYDLEMAHYTAPNLIAAAEQASVSGLMGPPQLGPPKKGRRPRKPKKIKDPNAPKRCMSAFFWFSQARITFIYKETFRYAFVQLPIQLKHFLTLRKYCELDLNMAKKNYCSVYVLPLFCLYTIYWLIS